jgi:hypothetical protein
MKNFFSFFASDLLKIKEPNSFGNILLAEEHDLFVMSMHITCYSPGFC